MFFLKTIFMTDYNNPDFWNWIQSHINDDIHRLRLNARDNAPWAPEAINHIESTRRVGRKFIVGDTDLTPRLMSVPLSVEQATSASVAMLHRVIVGDNLLSPGATVLDMTCGLGIDALAMSLSPGVNVTAIEMNPDVAAVAAFNFACRPNVEIIQGDSISWLRDNDRHFSLIFIDPARRDASGGRVYNLHDCTPDVTTILPLLRSRAKTVMIKLSPMLDITQTINDLPGITQVHIIDDAGECRELLAVVAGDDQPVPGSPTITAWHQGHPFTFTRDEENSAVATTGLPRQGQYLFEPSPAMMKAAPFRLIASRYNLSKLHPNTHLYVGDSPIPDFPGRTSFIDTVHPYSSSALKQLKRRHLQADVACRNFTITPDQLAKRLSITRSGVTRLVGVTAADSNPYILEVSRPTSGTNVPSGACHRAP